MGQAKRRGSREARVAQSVARKAEATKAWREAQAKRDRLDDLQYNERHASRPPRSLMPSILLAAMAGL